MTPPAPTSSPAPNSKHPNSGLALTVPDELVTAIADQVASRLTTVPQGEPPTTEPGKLALTKAEAAEALGMSVDHLERHVLPDLRIVRSGRLRLVPVAELEAWIERNSARALEAVA